MSIRSKRYFARTAAAGLGVLFFYAPGSFSTPLNYPGSGSPVVTTGAEANCGGTPGGPSNLGPYQATCSLDTRFASADLPNAEIKVSTSRETPPPPFFDPWAQAGFVDLITVTDGFDSDGNAQGTFDLLIDGWFDVSDSSNESAANFFVAIWNALDPLPPCIYDADDCGFTPGAPNFLDYDYAEVWFDFSQFNTGDILQADIYSGGTGSGEILSSIGSDLRASLSVAWTVNQANPSYYVAAMGYTSNYGKGTSDFANTARATLAGPDGFEYTSENGFADESLAVPVPAPLALIALGLTCLAWFRRRF